MNLVFASPAAAESAFTMTVSFIGILIALVITGITVPGRSFEVIHLQSLLNSGK